jgi:hypothetical protein
MAVVSRRDGFIQIGEKILNLRCVEMVLIEDRVIVALTSGRTIDLYDEDAVDFLAFLGDFQDIMDEAEDAWEKREREADEPLEGPDW